MKSFATGVTGLAQLAFDILKNTVMLPIDLMTPDEDKGASKDTIGVNCLIWSMMVDHDY